MEINELSGRVIGAAIEVHRVLGHGLLESTYQKCLVYELRESGIFVQEEFSLPIHYKALLLDNAYRLDMLVNRRLVVELKAADKISPVNITQLLSYLKIKQYKLGLLINFNLPQLKQGIKRVINKQL